MKKLVWMVIFLWGAYVHADAVSDALQAKLNAIQTMSATFHQTVSANKRAISKTFGTMALSRPGRFRWETKGPMAQLVIADGQHLWVYDVDLEQVSVRKQEKSLGGTAALFLSSYDQDLTRDFVVTSQQKNKKIYFDLRAKSSKAHFQRMILAFSGADLVGIDLFDPLGQHTDVALNQVKNNPKLPSQLFVFKTPPGVDRVEQ